MEGVDPEKENEQDKKRNACIYACEKNNVDML